MSGQPAAELYRKWFGIPPHELPTHAYRLLGIRCFEADPDVIGNAVEQRRGFLTQFLRSEQAPTAQAVLDELKQIEQCLLVPEMKAAYDAQLRQYLAARQAATSPSPAPTLTGGEQGIVEPIPVESPAAAARPLAPTEVPAFIPLPNTTNRPAPRRRLNQKNVAIQIAMIGAGGVAGIAIGLLVVAYIRPDLKIAQWLGRKPATSTDTTKAADEPPPERARAVATSAPLAPQPPKGQPRPDRPTTTGVAPTSPNPAPPFVTPSGGDPSRVPTVENNPRGVVPVPKPAAPNLKPETTVASSGPAKPPVAVTPATPAEPLANLPAAIELPSLLARTPRELLLLAAAPDDSFEIELLSDAVSLDSPLQFRTGRTQDQTARRWHVYLVGKDVLDVASAGPALAEFSLDGRQLMFRWFEAAVDTAARQLQNCLLRITLGGQRHDLALRPIVPAESLTLSLAERTISQSIPLEQLPGRDVLQIEITNLAGFPANTSIRNDKRTAAIGQDLQIDLGGLEGACLRLRTVRRSDDELTLLIFPLYKNGAIEFDLTLARLEAMKQGSGKALADAQQELPVRVAELQALQQQYSSVSSISPNNVVQAAALKQQLDAIAASAKSVGRKIELLQKKIAENTQRLQALPNVEAFVNSLHNQAKLSFRLFVTIDGHPVTLYQAG